MSISDSTSYRRLVRLTRPATAPVRVLPNYIIVGAQKAGSSTLYRQLRSHPANVRAEIKECHFFDQPGRPHTRRRYRRHFPTRAHMGLRALQVGEACTGEATPCYLFHPLVPARMRAVVPQVRLIAVLREPVSRTISHYAMARRNGKEPLPFAQAIRTEDERLAQAWEQVQRGKAPGRELVSWSYTARGDYALQLARYLEYFDREQLLVLRSEELRNDPATTLERCRRHVGLPDLPGWDIQDRHVNVGSEKPEVTADDRAFLRERFREPNERLADEWGIDFRTTT